MAGDLNIKEEILRTFHLQKYDGGMLHVSLVVYKVMMPGDFWLLLFDVGFGVSIVSGMCYFSVIPEIMEYSVFWGNDQPVQTVCYIFGEQLPEGVFAPWSRLPVA